MCCNCSLEANAMDNEGDYLLVRVSEVLRYPPCKVCVEVSGDGRVEIQELRLAICFWSMPPVD